MKLLTSLALFFLVCSSSFGRQNFSVKNKTDHDLKVTVFECDIKEYKLMFGCPSLDKILAQLKPGENMSWWEGNNDYMITDVYVIGLYDKSFHPEPYNYQVDRKRHNHFEIIEITNRFVKPVH